MPTAPPARPHSAHPHRALPSALFRTSSSPRRPPSAASASTSAVSPDWEDAWDSSSDKEDNDGNDNETPHAPTAPIPIAHKREPTPPSSSISTSWVSASYQPTPAQGTPPASRPLPAPAPTRLPPGGAWEIVETIDAAEPCAPEHPKGAEAMRADAEDVMRDPMHLLAGLSLGSAPNSPAVAERSPSQPPTPGTPSWRTSSVERKRSVRTERRRERFVRILNCGERGSVNVSELQKLAWSGVPEEVRPIVWQLLLNYLPLPVQPRLATLSRKRKEYAQLVEQSFGRGQAALDQQIWHQIEIDVPRTRPGAPLWSCPATQRALERILYVWAIRHPASGYVQGINDLATPFFEVFLSAYVSVDPENFDVAHLPDDILAAVEADSFWCLTKLLDGIQDHYISQQPGIQRLVRRMGDLVKRIDPALAAHFDDQGVEYMQFAFRWMNCLLMREITVKCTIRMWDTYLSEGADAFSQFHLYVCCALLVKFSDRLREMDFQEIIMFLQRLPTMSWTDVDIELLLSEAFLLKTVWHGAENHFAGANGSGPGFGMMGR